MLLHSCLGCRFHSIKENESQKMSYCARENYWSMYSKCIAYRALEFFLKQDRMNSIHPFSALDHFYPKE